MSLKTPSKILELQIKLYRQAKNEFSVPSHGTRHFSDEVGVGVLRLRDVRLNPRS